MEYSLRIRVNYLRTLDEEIEAALNVEAFVNMESGRRQEARYTGYSRALEEEQTVKPVEVVEYRLEKAVDELIARAENRIQQMLNRVAPQCLSGIFRDTMFVMV